MWNSPFLYYLNSSFFRTIIWRQGKYDQHKCVGSFCKPYVASLITFRQRANAFISPLVRVSCFRNSSYLLPLSLLGFNRNMINTYVSLFSPDTKTKPIASSNTVHFSSSKKKKTTALRRAKTDWPYPSEKWSLFENRIDTWEWRAVGGKFKRMFVFEFVHISGTIIYFAYELLF